MEFIWAWIKGWRATRYDAVWVRDYVRRFFDELSEDDLAKIVDHCAKVADGMIEDEGGLFLDDDLAPDSCGTDGGESDGDDGTTPGV